jgi:hypothetical protein
MSKSCAERDNPRERKRVAAKSEKSKKPDVRPDSNCSSRQYNGV